MDGRRADIPSFRLKPGNEVRFHATHLKLSAVQEAFERMKARPVPAYVQVLGAGEGMRYMRLPEREEIPVDVNEPFIVEYHAQRS